MRGRVNSEGVEREKEEQTFRKVERHKERKREQKSTVHAPEIGNEQGEKKKQF